ncbi:MAG: hypothetical protein WBW33_07925 [Bryobacteraceae bacterium]
MILLDNNLNAQPDFGERGMEIASHFGIAHVEVANISVMACFSPS